MEFVKYADRLMSIICEEGFMYELRFIVAAFVDIAIDDIDDTMCFFSNIPCQRLRLISIDSNLQ